MNTRRALLSQIFDWDQGRPWRVERTVRPMARRAPVMLLPFALALILGGCASVADQMLGTNLVQVSEGRRLAEQRCASCHAIDGTSQGPETEARSFAEIAERRRGRSLEWQLETISDIGHFSMPAIALSPAEQASLAAYIRRQRPKP